MMEEEYKKRNIEALIALNNGDFDKAQELLHKNAESYPNGCTLNNLGVFYCACGMRQRNGRVVSAWKAGFNYLLKASEVDTNAVICGNLGTAFFKQESYLNAFNYFRKAQEINDDCLLRYNMGVCLYMSEKYCEATALLPSVLDEISIERVVEALGSHPAFLYCFSIIGMKKSSRVCERVLTHFFDELHEDDNLYDLFMLLFALGKYKEAWSLVDKLNSQWFIDDTVASMIVECSEHLNFDIDETILSGNKSIKRLKKNKLLREKCILDYKYKPMCAALNPWYD